MCAPLSQVISGDDNLFTAVTFLWWNHFYLAFSGDGLHCFTCLAMIKGVKALVEETKIGINYEYWIIIAWLSLILMGIMFLTIERMYKMPIFRNINIPIQLR